ncbi:MAG: S26 family signal peptidase [Neisseriaceae bacterium]|jgi:signal peptidase I
MVYQNIKYKFLIYYILIITTIFISYLWIQSRLIFNDTISLPKGLYLRLPVETPEINNIYEFTINSDRLEIAKKFGYHANGTFLKKLVAKNGDNVTINQHGLLINGKYIAPKGIEKARNMNLYPIEHMNYKLKTGEYFFLGLSKHSYDSRYFGIIKQNQIKYQDILIKEL